MSFKRILKHEWPRSHCPVHVLVVGCSDRRIKGSRGLFGEYMGFDMSIPITIPGGIKDLVHPNHPRDTESLLEKIALFGDAITTIVAKAHNDCVACNHCQDLAFYEDMLLKGGAVLRERFPTRKIIPVFIDFSGFYAPEEFIDARELVAV